MIIYYNVREKNDYVGSVADTFRYRLERLGMNVSECEAENALNDSLLCESDADIINERLAKERFILMIMSRKLCESQAESDKLCVMRELVLSKKLDLFTVFCDMEAAELPRGLFWIKNTKMYTVRHTSDIRKLAVNIAKKYWITRVGISEYQDFAGFLEVSASVSARRHTSDIIDLYVSDMLKIYRMLDFHDVGLKMMTLITLHKYLLIKLDKVYVNEKAMLCINSLLENVCSGKPCSQNELDILNFCMLYIYDN